MIDIYSDTSGTKLDEDNKFFSIHDGNKGSWSTTQLFVRNDDSALYYTNINLAISIDGLSEGTISANSIVYQLFPGSVEPTVAEWRATPFHNNLDLGDLGSLGTPNTSTYISFFIRIYSPSRKLSGTLQEANLKLTAIELAV